MPARPVAPVQELVHLPPGAGPGHGTRLLGVDLAPADGAGLELGQKPVQTGQVELVLQTRAPGLEQNREVAVARRGIEQLLAKFEAAYTAELARQNR